MARSVPPAHGYPAAFIGVAKHYNWKNIVIVTDGDIGLDTYVQLDRALADKLTGLCSQAGIECQRVSYTDGRFPDIPETSAFFLALGLSGIKLQFMAHARSQCPSATFVSIWDTGFEQRCEAAEGLLVLDLDFSRGFQNSVFENFQKRAFESLWTDFDLSEWIGAENLEAANQIKKIPQSVDDMSEYTVGLHDAIYIYAHALELAIKQRRAAGMPDGASSVTSGELVEQFPNVNFNSLASGGQVTLNFEYELDYLRTNYSLFQYQIDPSTGCGLKKVGRLVSDTYFSAPGSNTSASSGSVADPTRQTRPMGFVWESSLKEKVRFHASVSSQSVINTPAPTPTENIYQEKTGAHALTAEVVALVCVGGVLALCAVVAVALWKQRQGIANDNAKKSECEQRESERGSNYNPFRLTFLKQHLPQMRLSGHSASNSRMSQPTITALGVAVSGRGASNETNWGDSAPSLFGMPIESQYKGLAQSHSRGSSRRGSRSHRHSRHSSKFVLDASGLVVGRRLSTGASGAVYVGSWYGKEVAVKELIRQVSE
jgi:hypothetical protein